MAKINQTRENKFKASLKSWGEDDNRPLIRTKEDLERDHEERKAVIERIQIEKKSLAYRYGIELEQVHLWTVHGPDEMVSPINNRRIKITEG